MVTQLLAKLDTEAWLSEADNRLDDQENWSSHNNIKIIHLPECTEGANAKEWCTVNRNYACKMCLYSRKSGELCSILQVCFLC